MFQDPNKGQTTTLFPVETSLSKAHVIKNKIKKKKEEVILTCSMLKSSSNITSNSKQKF